MHLIRRTPARFWLSMIVCVMAGGTLAAEAQAQQPGRDRRVRVVIPEGMPAFDPSVRDRHPEAAMPRALVFPVGPGEEGISVILMNPRHADLETFVAAVSMLTRALTDGRTEIQAVIGTRRRDRGGPEEAIAARDLARLKASPHMKVPKLAAPGRAIEVIVDLAAWQRGES